MTDEVKKLVKNKQEIAHNDELGNNYYPSGWKPQRSWDNNTNSGEVTHIQPQTDNFKFDSLLQSWGFNSDEFFIEEESIKFSTWDTQLKGGKVEQMYAFKATIRRKRPKHDKFFKELQRHVKSKKPLKVSKQKGSHAFFYICADCQSDTTSIWRKSCLQFI